MVTNTGRFRIVPGRFDGRRAVVTGGGSGIGQATARRLGAEGAHVALVDKRPAGMEDTAGEISEAGGVCHTYMADCSVEEEIASALDDASTALGGIDVFVANAGIERREAPVEQLTLEGWNALITNNLTGMFLSCKHALRHLGKSGGGSIVCLGSNLGSLGMAPDLPAYSASKGGAFALMRAMAADGASRGIRVNMVIPGFIATPMNDPIMGDPEQLEYWSSMLPIGRPGTADEVAAAILWLSSDDASYCVGTALVVDGGQSSI